METLANDSCLTVKLYVRDRKMVKSITLKFSSSGTNIPYLQIPVGGAQGSTGVTLSINWGDGYGFETAFVGYTAAPKQNPDLNFTQTTGRGTYTGTGIVTIRGEIDVFGYSALNFSDNNNQGIYDSGWDTSSGPGELTDVTDISGVFNLYGAFTGCTSLTSVPSLPAGFNKSLSYCFAGCTSLDQNMFAQWNVRAATDYAFFIDRVDLGISIDNTLSADPFRSLAMQLTFNFSYTDPNGLPSDGLFNLPITGSNVIVDWGDGGGTHTYNSLGTINFVPAGYTSGLVIIYGNCTQFGSGAQSWQNGFTLASVNTWGSIPWTSFSGAFYGCSNLLTVPQTLPTTVTNVEYMFVKCTNLGVYLIEQWDISRVTSFTQFLTQESDYRSIDVTLSRLYSPFKLQCIVLSVYGSHSPSGLPVTYNGAIYVDWGLVDMTSSIPVPFGMSQGLARPSSQYQPPQLDYTIYIYGNITSFGGANWDKDPQSGDSTVNSVLSWGSALNTITNLSSAFSGCDTLTSIPSILPPNVTDTSHMFEQANLFNQNVGAWDVSRVTDMSYMFYGTNFNGSLSDWDVSGVKNMSYMFANDTMFNKISAIKNWNTRSVTDMGFMFFGTISVYTNPTRKGNLIDYLLWNVNNVTAKKYFLSPNGGGGGAPADTTLTDPKSPFYISSTPTVPAAPTNVVATALDASSATVTWTAPSNNGGSTITGYTVTSSPGAYTATWTSGPLTATVIGLTNGTAYTFTVTATNTKGTGPASTASNSVTPLALVGPPEAPTNVVATAWGSSSASVTWIAPTSNGGAAITSYTVTSTPGSLVATWTSGPLTATVTGLTNGTAYTFTVTATNTQGTGPASTASNSVTPLALVGPPEAPTNVVATAWGSSSASVTWIAPTSNGGAAITSYTVTSTPGSLVATWTSGPLTATVTGLTTGTPYTFTVTATNAQGTGPASAPSSPLISLSAPGLPTNVVATALDASSATVTWTPPANNGGTPIIDYVILSSPPDSAVRWVSGPLVAILSGLTPGSTYTFSVGANNAYDDGLLSAPSNAVTLPPASFPGAPTIGTATLVDSSSATVTWTAPSSDGGVAISGYTVTSSPGNFTASWTSGALTATVTGLTNGTPYTFTVTATNSVGTGPASAPSSAVTPTNATSAPGAPTGVSATAGNASATVTWTAPSSDGGVAISGYTVTSSPGNFTASWTSGDLTATVTGLTNGTPYTFTVTATNSVGTGPASAASAAVTPSNTPPNSSFTRLAVFNSQPNPCFSLGSNIYGTAGSVLFRLNSTGGAYTALQTVTGTPIGILNRIGNSIFGVIQSPNTLFYYNTDTSQYGIVGTLAGTPTGLTALDPSGNLYATDSTGAVYKVTGPTTMTTIATTSPVITGALTVSNNVLYGLSSSGSLVQLNLATLQTTTATISATAIASSVLVDSGVAYYYDVSGSNNVLRSRNLTSQVTTTLWNFEANPLLGTAPAGKILINPTTQVLYGICNTGGAGNGGGSSAAGTFFSFTLSSSTMTVLVNYVAGNNERGFNPISFSITNEVGNSYIVTQTGSSVGANFRTRVVGPFNLGQAVIPSFPPNCFNTGTKILSLKGDEEVWTPIESLAMGDMVKSYKHGYRAITRIGKGSFINNPELWHTCMYEGQKDGHEPLLVTGGHGLLVDTLTQEEEKEQAVYWGRDEQIIDDKILMVAPVSKEFKAIQTNQTFTYYHFVLENDGDANRRYGVWANGFLTETPSLNLYNTGAYNSL